MELVLKLNLTLKKKNKIVEKKEYKKQINMTTVTKTSAHNYYRRSQAALSYYEFINETSSTSSEDGDTSGRENNLLQQFNEVNEQAGNVNFSLEDNDLVKFGCYLREFILQLNLLAWWKSKTQVDVTFVIKFFRR